jgi:hypothetical protein
VVQVHVHRSLQHHLMRPLQRLHLPLDGCRAALEVNVALKHGAHLDGALGQLRAQVNAFRAVARCVKTGDQRWPCVSLHAVARRKLMMHLRALLAVRTDGVHSAARE